MVKAKDKPVVADGIAVDRLRSIVERIERLEAERKAIGNDVKDIYGEAKSAGFDVKVIRKIIWIRKQDMSELEEFLALQSVYCRALGINHDAADL